MQNARQSRIPPMVQALLGSILSWGRLRRKGASGGAAAPATGPSASSRTSGAGSVARRANPAPPTTGAMRSKIGGGASSATIAENNQLKQTVEGLERERDFYFSKLRDIELLVQQAVEQDPDIEKDENGLIKLVQAILYSTEVSSVRT